MTRESARLGKTELGVSRLCFGGWQASGWASSDDAKFIDTLRYAIDSGINFIDTAEAYGKGHSETLIAKAVRDRRDKVILATKFWFTSSKPADIRKSLEQSLGRLGTDYVDLYQQHWPPKAPPLQESLDELVKMKAEGKIRAVGVSNWMEPEWQEIKDPAPIDSLQTCYSLLWRSIEPAVLPLCRRSSISVLAYSPLAQGLLAGRFKALKDVPNDFRKQNRLFSGDYFPSVLKVVGELEAIASDIGKPPAAVALRWLLDRPGLTAVIAGATSRAQVDQNLLALDWRLPEETAQRLSEISTPLSASLKPHETMWNWHPRE